MCTKPGSPSRNPSLQHVEAQETRRAARARSCARARALASRVHRLRLQRRVAVLLLDIALERLRRRVQQIAREASTGPSAMHVLVHRILAPARAAAIEEARVPVRIAFAVASQRPRKRLRRAIAYAAAAGGPARSPRGSPAASSGVTRSSASRHSTQSWRPRPPRNSSAAPKPVHARSITRAPGAAGNCYGIIAAARIDDDGLGSERRRREAVRELTGGIARDDDERSREAVRTCAGGRRRRSARRALRSAADSTWFGRRVGARSGAMSGVLVVRPSSLGDVVHALALVADIRAHRPALAVDWVAEEAFAPLVRLDPRIRRVISARAAPLAASALAPATWREFAAFRRALARNDVRRGARPAGASQGRADRAARARAVVTAPTARSIREPLATLVRRCITIASTATSISSTAAGARGRRARLRGRTVRRAWQLARRLRQAAPLPDRPYALALPRARVATTSCGPRRTGARSSRISARAGLRHVLALGQRRGGARSERLAADEPRRDRAAAAVACPSWRRSRAARKLVVGVDTGLMHLAAALGTPTIALFTATDAAPCRRRARGSHARDLGGNGPCPRWTTSIAAGRRRAAQRSRC